VWSFVVKNTHLGHVAQVATVKIESSKARTGEWQVYAVRIAGSDGCGLLTALLHGQNGNYDSEAVAAWTALQSKVGPTVYVPDRA
jgi:hypothetical protein